MGKPKVYIETSVVSYLVSLPSRMPLILGQQQTTKKWWKDVLPQCDPFVSPIVIQEVREGNPEMARQRLEAIHAMTILTDNDAIIDLADRYLARTGFPDKLKPDAYHMAAATIHGMNYLVTWNCSHIAAGWVRRLVDEINLEVGLPSPVICTPLEMMKV